MEKNRRRALRRHHTDRMHKHAMYVLTHCWNFDDEWANRSARRWRDNLKVCSCWSCGNPRRHLNESTFAELKATDSAKDALEDYFVTLEE